MYATAQGYQTAPYFATGVSPAAAYPAATYSAEMLRQQQQQAPATYSVLNSVGSYGSSPDGRSYIPVNQQTFFPYQESYSNAGSRHYYPPTQSVTNNPGNGYGLQRGMLPYSFAAANGEMGWATTTGSPTFTTSDGSNMTPTLHSVVQRTPAMPRQMMNYG